MKQDTILIILGLTPLIIGGIIAGFNSIKVNNRTEKIEAWTRRQQFNVSTKRGWFSRYVLNPILWILVKFFNWTDSFSNRGIKSGVRVSATLYLIAAWCLVLYLAFMAALVVVISGVIIYIFYKIVFTLLLNSNSDFKSGYNISKNIFGTIGNNKRINQNTGIIQERGMVGWNDTEQRIDPETGQLQEKGMFGWNDTDTKFNQETGIVQKEGFLGYEDTDTRIDTKTGIIQKKGFMGWDDTEERIDPETGRHQKKGLFGWDDL